MSEPSPADVIAFWREAGPDRWFTKDAAFDEDIRQRFLDLHERAAAGKLTRWEQGAEGALALLILLDQFPRNMFRGTARMFEADRQALAAAVEGVARHDDERLTVNERSFLYMPYMHSEEIGMQERSVSLFTDLANDAPSELRGSLAAGVQYAKKHHDIIERFGRFPHRNTLLGRESTPAELAFIAEPGSGF